MQTLYLIRHGETDWSLSGQHTSFTDLPLTRRGEDMARDLTALLEKTTFAKVFSSPRLRARQTCELAGLHYEIEPDLDEWNYGIYEGITSADIRLKQPDWNIFRDGCPQGETPLQIETRADRLIRRLSDFGGNIALFSHGQFGCALAARWIGQPVLAAEHLAFDPAALSIMSYGAHHPDVRVIALWNRTTSR